MVGVVAGSREAVPAGATVGAEGSVRAEFSDGSVAGIDGDALKDEGGGVDRSDPVGTRGDCWSGSSHVDELKHDVRRGVGEETLRSAADERDRAIAT